MELDNIVSHRSAINQHKMFGGFQCECCGGGKNGRRRRRRAPRYMLRAMAQGKKVNHYPSPHFGPPSDDDDAKTVIYGLSSWKKQMMRKSASVNRIYF